MLIRKIAKPKKEGGRYKSQRHLRHVREHACVNCDTGVNIEAAHVRLGSDGGMGRKPSDYYAVALCGGLQGCHARQHQMGEASFWAEVGKDPAAVIAELIRTSPVRREIEAHRNGG